MKSVLIYVAGSIGNHLAYACRNKGWNVTICDVDPQALERTKNLIYPQRYGQWDDSISLIHLKNGCLNTYHDVVVIGTPPDIHIDLAIDILRISPPKILLIEKPLCTPAMKGCHDLLTLSGKTGTFVLVGYNHTLTDQTRKAEELLATRMIGKPLYMYAAFREHWEGIFNAHPWLNGPKDSYLGYSARGGGAGGEHSHALNIWQHFSKVLGMGKIVEVAAMLDVVDDGTCNYDRIFQVNVRTEKGLLGHIVQDVITKPPQKILTVQGDSGFLGWYVNRNEDSDAIRYGHNNLQPTETTFSKTRPDDFRGEIDHIEEILGKHLTDSPISLENGLDTMLVLAACHLSHQSRRVVRINYRAGYLPNALKEL